MAQGADGTADVDEVRSSGAPLTFPDLPRMELDQLLEQLVERAQEVMGTQGRLRALLRANQAVSEDLTLSTVLSRIIGAARDLVGARYAALGVLAPEGGLAELFTGLPEDVERHVEETVGHLPHGTGLLGALIEDPRPIRLRNLADDPRSVGPPPGHPPMHSFLGVPIRVRGEVFGNLYVTESLRGEFTPEDEELLTALATSAGVSIDNARLYEAARSRGELLAASATVLRELLTADLEEAEQPLRLIAERTLALADADLVLVLRPARSEDPVESLTIDVAVGVDADELQDLRVPLTAALTGSVFTRADPVLLADLTEGTGIDSLTSSDVQVGSALAVPLVGSQRVRGVLAAGRLVGRAAFTSAELGLAGSFANHAAVAIELAEARAQQQLAALLDDRERIAADLHDHVIQRLFASGLTLQSLAPAVAAGPAGARLAGVIRDLDETISQIRSTIFELHSPAASAGQGVGGRLVDLLADARAALGFEPGLGFSGLLEDLPVELVDDLLAVAREALTNVAKHAGARTVAVDLRADPGRLTLRVSDDGRGIGEVTRCSGLDTMRRRAERYGGALDLTGNQPSGTVLTWVVPLVP